MVVKIISLIFVAMLLFSASAMAYSYSDRAAYEFRHHSTYNQRIDVQRHNLNVYRNYNPPSSKVVRLHVEKYHTRTNFDYTPTGKFFESKRNYVNYRCDTDSKYRSTHYC